MTVAYLSLGTNLGDRLQNLVAAVRLLSTPATRVTRVSSVYETAPQGKTDQPTFLNMAVEVDTALGPRELLQHIQSVEQQLGRVRVERWGPRVIDVDIVLYGDVCLQEEDLMLPHPRMQERAFVLLPLLELSPQLPYKQALESLPDQGIAPALAAASFFRLVSGVQ